MLSYQNASPLPLKIFQAAMFVAAAAAAAAATDTEVMTGVV